jgi:outer membrane protein OmpA-like peptidoglycan-associated protein
MPVRWGDTDTIFFSRLNSSQETFLGIGYTNQSNKYEIKPGKDWFNWGAKAILSAPFPDDQTFLLRQRSRGAVKILRSLRKGKLWKRPKLLFKYKKGDWKSGAYISDSGDTIIFPMQGKDSFGEEDLYVVTRGSLGKWSDAINLGTTINTSGSETAPYLFKGRLFFTSDGRPGSGGLDIFVARQLYGSWNLWSAPEGIDEINTRADESHLRLYEDGTMYFTREIEQQERILRTTYTVADTANNLQNRPFVSQGTSNVSVLKQLLQREDGYVFFGVDSDRLNRKGKELLFFVAQTLFNQPDVAIVINGHADQEGNSQYNTELSERRALSVKEFLASLGIQAKRMRVVAQGETLPLAVGFSEQAKRRNRRVQIDLIENNTSKQARTPR